MELIYTNPLNCKKLCKLLKAKYIDESRVDGLGIIKIEDIEQFNKYLKYLKTETIEKFEDDDSFFIKIIKHNPQLFRILKINRILNKQ